MSDKFPRLPGESTADWLARFAGKLAEASLVAQGRGDDVQAIFFATKGAEVLSLAKALGFDARRALASEDEQEQGR
jgi:hypothetical protein